MGAKEAVSEMSPVEDRVLLIAIAILCYSHRSSPIPYCLDSDYPLKKISMHQWRIQDLPKGEGGGPW